MDDPGKGPKNEVATGSVDDDTLQGVEAYKKAMQWRMKYISERRAKRVEETKERKWKTQVKAQLRDDMKSKVLSKALLLGEVEPQHGSDKEGSTESSSDDDDDDRKSNGPSTKRRPRSESGSSSDSDSHVEPYWSAERGFEWRLKGNPIRQTEEEKKAVTEEYEDSLARRDKFVIYPMIVITPIAIIICTILAGHAFLMDGTLQRVGWIGIHTAIGAVLAFVVLVQFTFLYEHYTQVRAFRVVSGGFVGVWAFLWAVLFYIPELGVCSLAGGTLATFLFSVLGLYAKPGTSFPLVFQTLCAYLCYLFWPVCVKFGGLLCVSLGHLLGNTSRVLGEALEMQ